MVAIVGRPNVGKSTLLNALVGQKISITSRKAQTTRHRITGIRTLGTTQFVFVDTPGFQTKEIRGRTALNRTLNRTVTAVLGDVDVVLFMVEAGRFSLDDAKVLALLPPDKPVFLVANKLDVVASAAPTCCPGSRACRSAIRSPNTCRCRRPEPTDVDPAVQGILKPYLPAAGLATTKKTR